MMATPQSKAKINKTLYINKQTGKPEKMQIKDTNKKASIDIIYNEVTVNS